jgi:hypothetical protein
LSYGQGGACLASLFALCISLFTESDTLISNPVLISNLCSKCSYLTGAVEMV